MKILLIQPPVQDFYQTSIRTQPVGLASLAAVLVKKGHQVEILDCQRSGQKKRVPVPDKFLYIKEFFPDGDISPFRLYSGFYHFGLSFEAVSEKVKRADPDLVGISCQFTPYVTESIKTAEAVKAGKPKVPVVFGGAHVSSVPQDVLGSPYVDYAVIGEGERSFADLVDAISEETTVQNIEGVGFREDGVLRINPVKSYIADIDSLPFPARDLLDKDAYRIKSRKYTMLLTSRGCPQGCSYCSVAATMGTGFRARSPKNVIAEMKACAAEQGITAFDIEDDNFTLDPLRAEKLLDLIIAEFGEQTVDLYAMNGLSIFSLTDALLLKMKQAGFKHLDLALGSSSGKINRDMNRPADLSRAEAVLRQAAKLGFPVTTYIILGIPGHSLEDMSSSVRYLAGKETFVGPSIFYPSPGTAVYKEMEQNGFDLSHDFSMLRSSLFPVETEDFTRLDIVTLLRLSRWINFLKQLLPEETDVNRLKNKAVSDWYPREVPVTAETGKNLFYLTASQPLKPDRAGEILTSFLLQNNQFFGIRRIKTANKDLYTYQIFPYKTSKRVMDIFFNKPEDLLIRQAVSKT